MGFLNTILSTIFPIKCLSCGSGNTDLCEKCLAQFPEAERETARWIFPIYDYRHPPVRKAIWMLKYKNRKRLAKVFAEILYDKIIEELSDLYAMENFRDPVLIPIPLSKKRHRERGYNQIELICQEIIKIANLRDENLKSENKVLVKIKETEHQARIKNRSKRLENVIGTFEIKNSAVVKNKNIILIDDVATTGATLSEARKVLHTAGARKIIAFTIAH